MLSNIPHVVNHILALLYYYSVPYRYARAEVDVRFTATTVEVFQKGERIASHPRSHLKGRHSTQEAHLAPAHQEVAGWNAQRFLNWAAKVGPQTQAAIEQVLASRVHPQQGYRTALGILRLAKTHGEDRLEAACLRAMQIQAVTYRTIASLLKHGLERKAPTPSQANLPADHANVRGSDYYH